MIIMKKKLNIKVNINAKFEVNANPNLKDWNYATDEQKNEYVKNRVREYLFERIDEIIDKLMSNSKIKF